MQNGNHLSMICNDLFWLFLRPNTPKLCKNYLEIKWNSVECSQIERLLQLVIYWSASLILGSRLQSFNAGKTMIKAPWTTILGDSIFKSIFYINSIKHFDFLDVPDAKVAVPPQKAAEGRLTYMFHSAVLYLH